MPRWLLSFIVCAIAVRGQSSAYPGNQGRPQSQPLSERGSVSGRVVDAASGEPIAGARVTIGGTSKTDSAKLATSDPAGGFLAGGLTPGSYFVSASHSEYPGALNLAQAGTRIEVRAGKETTGITVSLKPAGTISGVVLDDGGEPLSQCGVSLLPVPLGGAVPPEAGRVSTDDKGRFLLESVAPDRYLVVVSCEQDLPAEHILDVVGLNGFEPGETWQRTFYQNGTTRSDAAEISVASGAEVNLEFQLRSVPVHTIRGTVTPAPGLSWSTAPEIRLIPEGPDTEDSREWTDYLNVETGGFRFEMIPRGAYSLTAWTTDQFGRLLVSEAGKVVVGPAAPPPVQLQLRISTTVFGKVERPDSGTATVAPASAGQRIPPGGVPPMESPRTASAGILTLMPARPGGPFTTLTGRVSPQVGSFQIPGVAPGRWLVRYEQPQQPAWVESMQYGEAPVVNQEIEVTPDSPAILKMRTNPKLPNLQLEYVDIAAAAKSSCALQAVPDGEGSRGMPIRSDAGGSDRLVPGRYHLFGVEQQEGGVSLNERALRLLGRQVTSVEVVGGRDQTLQVRCFPAEEVQKIINHYIAGDSRGGSASPLADSSRRVIVNS
ncbi:carboxypeptidase-like regulatory domain-containing protein [uncultured Paludibaculum sp.]|uniref:carboxypeptidase-like regulatory domain-containing protein n=1 Tax=uncultured Paludibaculum sp. TaxID=1765020 RepID=UPI002AAAA8CB|nr:carboxypeptidase-like regulatory domain-containing protein [uncultured Paludibaculum sp.]